VEVGHRPDRRGGSIGHHDVRIEHGQQRAEIPAAGRREEGVDDGAVAGGIGGVRLGRSAAPRRRGIVVRASIRTAIASRA
jgi:N-acyl-D-aspartate/D-glutamate deacylase